MQGREAEAEIPWPLPFFPIPIFKGFSHWSQAESADMGTPACGGQHPISEQRSGEWTDCWAVTLKEIRVCSTGPVPVAASVNLS